MAEQIDINEEYKKIFGVETRETLFSADDEEYNALRQEILDAKREFNFKKFLPFDGIKLLSYDEFKRVGPVREAEKQGNRIFYIRKFYGTELVAYAAGYFNPRDARFVVLGGTFFKKNSYFSYLANYMNTFARNKFLANYVENNGVLTQKTLHSFASASIAASYVLGTKSSYTAWYDDRGKTLDAYYSYYKSAEIQTKEDSSFPDYIRQEHEESNKKEYTNVPSTHKNVINIRPDSIALQSQDNQYEGKHLFYIIETGRCIAKGFYEPETSYFYICRDSLVSKVEDSEYVGTTSAKARKRFIDKACKEEELYYRVSKDAKCKSASAAACYVLGRTVTYIEWTDEKGKYLKDFYPKQFIMGGMVLPKTGKLSEQEKAKEHLFFLKQEPSKNRYCNASGYYDVANEKFVLKTGSILAFEIVEQYKGSTFADMREKFLSNHCDIRNGKFVLRMDTIMNSPTMAASYVTGRMVKTRTIWIDSGGHTLNDIYGQK